MPTISIGFQIQNKGSGFQELILDADKFKNLLKETVTEAEKVKNKMVSFGSVSIGLDALSSAFQDLQGFTKGFTDAYDTQMEAERQLEQVMKNTMDARAEDVQGIKDFCSAQQEIGIVGDEVQLAGAQEMATYLELKSSLKTLIPVMNDMVAQQYGYNHTAENATGIATMLGKVMQGQTSALSRLGYSFDEAQEQILKYGTESERAAVLADVVSQSVGGMNRKLAETDSGRMKQLENTLGDVKEQIGGFFKKADPFIAMAANSASALIGVQKLCSGVMALAKSMRMLSVAGGAVSIAILALAAVYQIFTRKSDEATDAIKRYTDAKHQQNEEIRRSKELMEAEKEACEQADSAIQLNIATLRVFKGTKAEERKMVEKMNSTYGATMGYFKSVDEWYKALIANSEAYCRQLANEARARAIANQIQELDDQYKKIDKNEDGSTRVYSDKKQKTWRRLSEYESLRGEGDKARRAGKRVRGHYDRISRQGYEEVEEIDNGPTPKQKADAAKARINTQKEALVKEQEELLKKVPMPVKGAEEAPDLTDKGTKGGSKTVKTRRQEIDAEIKKLEERYNTASASEQESIRKTVKALEEEKRQIELTQAALYRPVETFDGGVLNTDGWTMQDFDAEIAYQMKLMPTVSNDEVAKVQKTIDSLQLQKEALTVPVELKSIEDYNKAIAYQQKLRSTSSTSEEIARHDEVINRLTKEVEMLERKAHIELEVDKITSYREVSEEIAYYTNLLHDCTEEERKLAEQNLPALMKKEKELGLRDAGIGIAKAPEETNTISETDAAISYYEQRIQNASKEEVEALQKTKMAFEEKKKVMERGIELPTMLKEADEINKLTGKEYKLKIRGMGFDELTEKIRELQKMLKDTENPVTDSQRKDIESLIGTYEKWRKEGIDSFDTFRDGWGSLKGISGTIEGLTDTLTGDANAWQKLTAIVDGFIQLFEGVKAIVGIINMLTMATQQHTVAKETEAAATATETAATVAQTSATIADTEATLANTAAKSGEAVAEATSSGAKMPFPLNIVAIAAGVAAVVGALAVVGKFADGGIVGGNSPTGDKLLARVNTGEMILNKKQQTNLFEFIKSGGGNLQQLGIPKFADGGIVSGPTLSLVGEYAGARNNPEVIAPLNKLRDLIGNDENGANGRVEFEIRGDRLWGILRKFERNKSRT